MSRDRRGTLRVAIWLLVHLRCYPFFVWVANSRDVEGQLAARSFLVEGRTARAVLEVSRGGRMSENLVLFLVTLYPRPFGIHVFWSSLLPPEFSVFGVRVLVGWPKSNWRENWSIRSSRLR